MDDNNGHDSSSNTEHTSHRPGPVRRTIAKIKNSTGLGHDPKESYVNYQDDRPHPHPQVEDMMNTVGYSLIQQIMQYLQGEDGEAAMEAIFATQSKVAASLAVSDEARKASRIAAQEVVVGSYDAVERKYQEWFKGLPSYLTIVVFPVAACYVFLLAMGILLSLWRFAFFGLQ